MKTFEVLLRVVGHLFWVSWCLYFAARELNVSFWGLAQLALAVLFIARIIRLDSKVE